MTNYYANEFNYYTESDAYGEQSYGGPFRRATHTQALGNQIYASRNENDYRKIFVGGLSWETTESDLHQYFRQFGEVVDVNLKINPTTNQSRGFGFILFKDKEAVDRTVECPCHILHGRTIDPKRAMAEGSRELNSKVFVGGLDPSMSKEEIVEAFSQYGKVEQIELPYDKVKNERRAFGFITFESEDVADDVCRNRKVTCGKKKVDVRRVYSKEHKPPPDAMNRMRGPSSLPPARSSFPKGQGRGHVDSNVYQMNGMYRSGCAEDDDGNEFMMLQDAFNSIAALASGLNFPASGGYGYDRSPYQEHRGYAQVKRGKALPRGGTPGRANVPTQGSMPGGRGAFKQRSTFGQDGVFGQGGGVTSGQKMVGFHPYTR